MIPVVTKRLILREVETSDFTGIHRYASDPRVVEHMWWGPNSEDQTRRFIAKAIRQRRVNPRVDFEFAVQLRAASTLIGGCALYSSGRPENATCEIGYCFLPEVWGQGYGAEAVAALANFGFREARAHRIFATIDLNNPASIQLVERLGFRREGLMLADALIRGAWRDSLVYALLESEWQPRQLARE